MESNSKLEELKKQVRDISNQQMLIQEERDRKQEMAYYLGQEQEQNQQEMMQLIHNVLSQNELVTVREREKLQDKLDAFSHKQTVMNEQLITLNDNLTDTAALKAIYEAKREELELDYQKLKNKYDRIISNKKTELAEIEHECKSLKIKCRNLKIKMIARNVLIAAIILFILAFAVRWGTLLRNQISSNETKSEQVGQISTETEKTDTDENRGFLEWLLPADE
jgi:cytochrome c556